MPSATEKKSTDFRVWLDKKRITSQDFAVAIGGRISTVNKWSAGYGKPSRQSRKEIASKFPDCPLLKR